MSLLNMRIKLHRTQLEVAKDKHRFRVVCAGRRWGKSVLSRMIVLKWAAEKPGLYWIVSPTFVMGKDIHWKQGFNVEIPTKWIAKKNEADLEIVLANGSRIALKSAENPDRLRGVKLSGLVVDEIAFLRDWDRIWEEALRPTLTDLQAPALFISTPRGYNAFYDLWRRGQENDPDWKSWRFTTYDNPFVPREEIDQAKNELDEDAFAQEYLAEFKKFTGLVYKDFSREKHVIAPIELGPDWTFYRAIDFGWAHPTAVLFVAVDPKGIVYIYDEIYQTGLQTPDLANLINQKSAHRHFAATVADSAQASDIAELQKYGLAISPVKKTSGSRDEDWSTFRIRKVSEKLRNGKLFVFENCQNTIWEFENYRYHEVREGNTVQERPMKVNDHAMDALSYMVVTLPEWVEPTYGESNLREMLEELPREEVFKEWS